MQTSLQSTACLVCSLCCCLQILYFSFNFLCNLGVTSEMVMTIVPKPTKFFLCFGAAKGPDGMISYTAYPQIELMLNNTTQISYHFCPVRKCVSSTTFQNTRSHTYCIKQNDVTLQSLDGGEVLYDWVPPQLLDESRSVLTEGLFVRDIQLPSKILLIKLRHIQRQVLLKRPTTIHVV